MSKTRLISPGIPNYTLKRNLQLNGKYISNDGGDEGIRVSDDGEVGIGIAPTSTLHLNASVAEVRIASTGLNAAVNFETIVDSASVQSKLQHIGTRFRFLNNSSEELVSIYNTGNMGIGVSDPDSLLEIFGESAQLKLSWDASNHAAMTVADDGALTIATTGTDADIFIDSPSDLFLDAAGGVWYFMHGGSGSQGVINTTGSSEFAISTVSNSLTLEANGGDINLVSDGGQIYLKKGSQSHGFFDLDTSSVLILRPIANYDLSFKALFDSTIIVDKDATATTDSTQTAFHIDYDHTGISADGQTIAGIGLDLDMNCESVTHVGTVNQTGIDLDMVAATDGTQTNTGIDIAVSGADTNIGMLITQTAGTHLKLAKDANDYATFTVADTGDLTIATVGDGTTDSDLTLDADGDIILDAATGITRFYLAGSTTDYASLTVAANGATTLATVDNGIGVLGNIVLDADGAIELDSFTGKFKMEKGGAEFSVADSAYAGMILGYRIIGEDAGEAHSGDLGTSFATIHDDCNVTFKAPPSGNVEITVQAYIITSSNSEIIEFGLSTTDTTSYTSLGVEYEQKVYQGDRSEDGVIQLSWVKTGLTPGAIDTYWLAAEATTGTTRLYWGGDATSDYPVFIMKATALPAAVTDYAVYG